VKREKMQHLAIYFIYIYIYIYMRSFRKTRKKAKNIQKGGTLVVNPEGGTTPAATLKVKHGSSGHPRDYARAELHVIKKFMGPVSTRMGGSQSKHTNLGLELSGSPAKVPTANNGMVLAVEPFFALLGHFGAPDPQVDADFNRYWNAGWDVDPAELTNHPGLVLENIYKSLPDEDRQEIIAKLRESLVARVKEARDTHNRYTPVLVPYPGANTSDDDNKRKELAYKFMAGKVAGHIRKVANKALRRAGEPELAPYVSNNGQNELTGKGKLNIPNFINGQNDRGRIVLREHVRNTNRTHENFLNLINNSLAKCMGWNNGVKLVMRARDALRSGVGRRVRARAAQRQFEEEQDRLMEAEVAAEADRWRRMQRAAVGLDPTGEKTWADEVGDEEEAKKAKLARIIDQSRTAEQQALYALGESGLAGYNGGRKTRKSKKRHRKQRKTRRA
jgi:hypothetical protein